MKKVTLSAAVLALSMMGCSDVGLDNSVASTNEVKNEPAQESSYGANFLAKTDDYYWPRIAYVNQKDYAPAPVSYGYPNVGIQLSMNTYPAMNSGEQKMYAVGKFDVTQAYRAPDMMRVITLPLYNCRMNPNLYCDNRGFYPGRSNNLVVKEISNKVNGQVVYDVRSVTAVTEKLSTISRWSSEQNSISYCIAVWNEGKSNEVILAGTVFNGQQFKNDRYLAEQAYNRFFIPAVNDWIINHQ